MREYLIRLSQYWARREYRLAVYLLVVGIITTVLIFAIRPPTHAQQQAERAWVVETTRINYQKIRPQISLFGTTAVPHETTLESTIHATVAVVDVKPGQTVKQGDRLVLLDTKDLRLSIRQQQAMIDEINARIHQETVSFQFEQRALAHEKKLLALAERQVQRESTLQSARASAQANLDSAREQYESQSLAITHRTQQIAGHDARMSQLQAQLDSAKAQLHQLNLDEQRAKQRAPFQGTITAVHVSKGSRVNPGEALVELFDIDSLEVVVFVPNRYLSDFYQAARGHGAIHATTQMSRHTYALTFNRLAGEIDPNAGSTQAVFNFDDIPSRIPLNLPLTLQTTLLPIRHVIALPSSAVYQRNIVFKIVDHRLVRTQFTRLGESRDAQGNQIVLARSNALSDGDRVLSSSLPNASSGLLIKEKVRHDAPAH